MKTKLYIIIIFLSMGLNGCILDSLDKINQNLPMTKEILISDQPIGTFAGRLFFDLDSSATYQDYADDITKLEFTSLSFRTDSLNIPTLEGDFEITFEYGSYSTVYSKRIKPEDYKTTPLIINLPASEIAKINDYLTRGGRAFIVYYSLKSVTPDSGTLYLRGYIDAVFNFEAEL
ncbi:MAG TPA: hypothetical protein VHP30_05015 [Ignavibacteriales bacterium]|nr:hypothetical protein [Ignavibacteriales bacterium]